MTKPESSMSASSDEQIEEIRIVSEAVKLEEEDAIDTNTAKNLFSDFAPDNSDSDEDEVVDDKKDDQAESSRKRLKDNSGRKYIPKYRKEWENKPELKLWLSESIHGNTYFYCKFCKKDYRCGISDIHKHMSSKKHKLRAEGPTMKGQKFKFRGLLCPVFTPFSSTKRITPDVNIKAIQKYAAFLNVCEIKGILINDIMGEGMALTIRERMDVTDAWVEACEKNQLFLMVQIGGAPLKDVIELAKHARQKDVGAIVILPDMYNKPKNHLDLIKYIKLVSDFSKSTPILYHHIPHYTNVEIDLTSFLMEITGEVDSFVGLIYSTNDIQQSMAAMAVNPDRFTVFMGTDEAVLGAVASGVTCIMAASLNFLPKLVESIYEALQKGNIKSAQTSQNLLNKTVDLLAKEGDKIAVFKAATDLITNICGCTTREPLQAMWEGTVKKMQGILRDLDLL